MSLERGSFSYSNYELCLKVTIDNILSLKAYYSLPVMIAITTQSISIFNRLFLQDREATLSLVAANTNLEQFIDEYILGSDRVTAKKSLRLNSIATMILIDQLPSSILLRHYLHFIKTLVRETSICYEESTGQAIKQTRVIHDRRRDYSQRKEELHNMQLYNDIDMISLFKQTVNVSADSDHTDCVRKLHRSSRRTISSCQIYQSWILSSARVFRLSSIS